MTCNEMAEFVSALCDGETVPRTAAEHIGACETCQIRLKEYIEMGAELRRVASLELSEAAPRVWSKQHGLLATWWQKGWEIMRIPRLAFALLLAAIVVLGSGLAMVGVRAHAQGTVLMLKITSAPGQSIVCPLSTVDKNWNNCAFIGSVKSGTLMYEIKFLSKDGDRVTLEVRTEFSGSEPGAHTSTIGLENIRSLPGRQYTFEAGETLQVDVAGLGPMALTGEWMDHVPAIVTENPELDPGPDELRIVSPLLLRGNDVVGDMEGGSVFAKAGQGTVIYIPGEGLFKLALSPLPGAVQGHVRLNRISFEADSQSYVFLTGAPITRSEHVWIMHDAGFKPSGENHPYIGSMDLNSVAPTGTTPN